MSNDSIYDSAPWRAFHKTDHQPRHDLPSLPALIDRASQKFADQKAFTTSMPNGMNGTLSYAQVDEMSDAFAIYLREVLSLEAGARVAVQMPNCLTLPVVTFGILKAGCVLVNVNPLYTRREMEHQFNDSGAEALVIIDMFADKLDDVIPKTGVRKVIITSVAQWFPPVVKGVLKAVLKIWNRAIPKHSTAFDDIESALNEGRSVKNSRSVTVADYWSGLTRDDRAVLQYTGGTTGVSKGAELTHGNLLSNMEQVDAVVGEHIAAGQECILTALPIYHIFAFTVNLLSFYSKGAHNILVPSPRPIQNLQRAFDNFPISWISGVNTLYNALLNEEWFTIYPPKTIRVALAGGASLHQSVAERWEKTVGVPILEGYGLTETSPVVCFNPPGLDRPGSIGIPAPETAVRIVDDQGHCVPAGEPGEIIVRGPQVMKGYWNRPSDSQSAIKDGWFYTGDVAIMEPDGYFRIVDRKKDMILVSGFNVYPNEVEDALALIDQVQESAVIGIPDDKTGEAVAAYIVLRDPSLTEQDVIAHCKRELTAYKIPKRIEFWDELPKTPVGKVLRKEVRAAVELKTQGA